MEIYLECMYNMPRLFVSSCCSHIPAHVYLHPTLLQKTSKLFVFPRQPISHSIALLCYAQVIPLPQSRNGRACQGLCGLHRAVPRGPLSSSLSCSRLAAAHHFMSCVIADLSLNRRPASVKIAVCSLQARPKSHQLLQSDRVSHNPLHV